MIWSDLFWSEASLKTLHLGPIQIASLSGRSRYHTQLFRKPDPLLPASQPSRCSCLLCEKPNRLNGLFYPLILYGTTHLYKLPNRSDGLFYSLTLDGLFTYCVSYQIGQTDSSTLWYLTASSLCKIPNRSNDIRRLFRYVKYQIGQITLNAFFAISKGWVMTIDMDCTPPRSPPTFDLYASLVWFANIIATLVSRRSGSEAPYLWRWQG